MLRRPLELAIYPATVIDCYSKKVMGWSIADHIRTELVEDALRNTAATSVIEPGEDSAPTTGASTPRPTTAPLSRTSPCAPRWAGPACAGINAMAESYFSPLNNERVYRTVYATKAQASRDIIDYIERFYNSRRRHSALGYNRPNEVPCGYTQPATAA